MSGTTLFRESATFGLTFKNEYRQQIGDLLKEDLYEKINSPAVFKDGKKLLEAFDGFVIVTVSKHFPIGETALPKYLDMDQLFISEEW
jgi:hypothetical protein